MFLKVKEGLSDNLLRFGPFKLNKINILNMKYELRHFLIITIILVGFGLDLYFTDKIAKLDYKDLGVFILVLIFFIHGVRKFILFRKKNLDNL